MNQLAWRELKQGKLTDVVSGFMESLPESSLHPLKSNSQLSRYARAGFLALLCSDYAEALQGLVDRVLERDDPYRGGNAEALLAITAAREIVRAASAIGSTSDMDELFASHIQSKVDEFEKNYPGLKQARDIIAHADEYMASEGRVQDQWFDTTNRFGENSWIFRVGNKLDFDMVKLAKDSIELTSTLGKIVGGALYVERALEFPRKLVKALEKPGLEFEISLDVETEIIEIRPIRTEIFTEVGEKES